MLASVAFFFKTKIQVGYSFRKKYWQAQQPQSSNFSLLNTGVCASAPPRTKQRRGQNNCHSSIIVQLVYHVLHKGKISFTRWWSFHAEKRSSFINKGLADQLAEKGISRFKTHV
jgi:hypothetical protein